ncbi:MAG: FKBP-type peptidyl-prolyl cis-trans isomerase [Candidatus Aenigmarchaeota archaeon]|nr:FKBP-type peptidyl-prolyl cis-trans isomerase [Candidatus Aenigmarchaeota archaeon]
MQHGDFVEVDYVGRVKITGDIFDLTNEEVAKKEKIHDPKAPYGPALIIVGSQMTVHGVMKELEQMNIGEERTFDVLPQEAFGQRDVRLIKILPTSKFIENKINPVPGEYFDIDGTQAKIQSVSGGRVRVDFNNPLAGKALTYDLKVVRKIEDDKEKIEKLLKYYRVDYTHVVIKGKEAEIKTKKPVNQMLRKFIGDIVTKWIKAVEKVEYVSEEDKKTEEKSESQDAKKE